MKNLVCFLTGVLFVISGVYAQSNCIIFTGNNSPSSNLYPTNHATQTINLNLKNVVNGTDRYEILYEFYKKNSQEENFHLMTNTEMENELNLNNSSFLAKFGYNFYIGQYISHSSSSSSSSYSSAYFPDGKFTAGGSMGGGDDWNYFNGQYLKNNSLEFNIGWRSDVNYNNIDYMLIIKVVKMSRTSATTDNYAWEIWDEESQRNIYIGGHDATRSNTVVSIDTLTTYKTVTDIINDTICYNEAPGYKKENITLTQDDIEKERNRQPAGSTFYSIIDKSVNFGDHCNGHYDSIGTVRFYVRQPLTFDTLSTVNILKICDDESTAGQIYVEFGNGVSPYTIQVEQDGQLYRTISNLEASQDYLIDSLKTGTYTLRLIDAEGCKQEKTGILITKLDNPNMLSVTLGVTAAITCHDGNNGVITANVQATSGTLAEPLTYKWSTTNGTDVSNTTENSINNIAAGEYKLRVNDPYGCFATNFLTIQNPDPITSKDTIYCCVSELENGVHYQDTVFYAVGEKEVHFTSAKGCDSTVTVTLIAFENPTVTIAVTNGNDEATATACVGETLNITANINMTNYVWTGNSILLTGTGSSISKSWSEAGAKTISVNFTETHTTNKGEVGCRATKDTTTNITILPLPDATVSTKVNGQASSLDITACAGQTVTLTSEVSEGVTYKWMKEGGIADGVGSERTLTLANITSNNAGKYVVEVTNMTTGCSRASDTVNITVNAPSVTLTKMNDQTICGETGEQTTLGIQATAGTGSELTYAWTDNKNATYANGQNNINNPTVTLSDTTEFYVVVTATIGTCTVEQKDTVVVNVNKPAVTLGTMAEQTICKNQSATLTAVVNSNKGDLSYKWTNNKTSDIIEGTDKASVSVNPTDTTTYTLTVTAALDFDNTQCRHTATQTVKVNVNAPAITLTNIPDTTICNGGTATLTPRVSTNKGTLSYSWKDQNAGENGVLSVTPTVTTTYYLEVTSTVGESTEACPAIAYDTVIVTVLTPTVTLAAINDTTICYGESVILPTESIVASHNGELSYTWEDGTNNLNELTVTPTETKTYNLTVTSTLTVGTVNCPQTATGTKTINVNQPVITSLTVTPSDTTICDGGAATIVANATSSDDITYRWDTQETGSTIHPATANTYTVTATATKTVNNVSCTLDSVKTAKVQVLTPSIALTAIEDQTVCNEANVTLTAAPTETPEGTVTYAWRNGTEGNYSEPSSEASYTITSATANTTVYLKATATKTSGTVSCPAIAYDTVNITVNSPAVTELTITPDPATICKGGSTTLTANATHVGHISYTWNNATTLNQSNTAEVTAAPSETTTYTVTCVDTVSTNGVVCTATESKTVTVTVNDTVILAFPNGTNANPTICLGGNIEILVDSANCQPLTITPALPAGLTFANGKISGTPTDAMSIPYTITAASAHGCSEKTLTGTIIVNDTVGLTVEHETQTICLGQDITPIVITYNNATISGIDQLAEGLNSVVGTSADGNTITISSAPSTAHTCEYTVTASSTHNCTQKNKNIKIEVKDSVSLKFKTGTNANPVICEGEAINIEVEAEHNSELTITPTSLPTGLTFGNNAISGTAESATTEPYAYTITAKSTFGEDVCATKTLSGTITVYDTTELTLANGTKDQAICLGTAISGIQFKVEHGTMSIDWISGTHDGLTFENGTLSGTPTTAGNIQYRVVAANEGSHCPATAHDTITGAITVNDTVNLTVENAEQTICLGQNIESIAITYNNANISEIEQLANGLTSNAGTSADGNTITISGAPSAADTYNYTVTATSTTTPNCESKSKIIKITVKDTVVSDITANGSICASASEIHDTLELTTEEGTEYTWNVDGGNIISDNSTKTVKVQWAESGSKTVRVSYINGKGCRGSSAKNITVVPAPAFSFSGSAEGNSICAYGTDTLTITPVANNEYTYTWSPIGSLTPINNTKKVLENAPAGSYSCTVTASQTTDELTCQTSQSISITVHTVPTVKLTVPSVIKCFGEANAKVKASISEGETPYNLVWNDNVNNNIYISILTRDHLAPQTYTVTVTDAHSCSATASIEVTQPAQLIVTKTRHENVDCYNGSNGVLAYHVEGGTPITNGYNFFKNNSNSEAGIDKTFEGLSYGIDTIKVTDKNGCAVTVYDTILQPTAKLNFDNYTVKSANCHGDANGEITVTVSGGWNPVNYAYTWKKGSEDLTISNNSSNTLTAGTYTITVKDDSLCTITQEVAVTEPEVLKLTVTDSADIKCFDDNNGMIKVNATGGNSNYTYKWDNEEFSSTTEKNNLTSGVHTVVVKDSEGCTDTVRVNIKTPEAALTVNYAYTNLTCFESADGKIDLTINGGRSPYHTTWDNESGIELMNRTGLAAGKYYVTVVDDSSCVAHDTITLTQPEKFSVAINDLNENTFPGNRDSICASEKANYKANLIATQSGYTYQWYKDDAILSNNTAAQIEQISNPAGTYEYKVVVTQPTSNCTQKDSVILTVLTVPTVTISGLDTICFDNEANLTANGAQNYQWKLNNVDKGTANPLTITQETGTDASFIHYYEVTGTTPYGTKSCSATAKDTVVINNPYVTLNAISDTTICEDGTATLITTTATCANDRLGYEWKSKLKNANEEPSLIAGQNNSTISLTGLTDTTIVYLTVTDTVGNCPKTTTNEIIVNVNKPAVTLAPITFSNNDTICPGNSTTLMAHTASSKGDVTFKWSANGTNYADTLVSPNEVGTHTYTVTATATVGSCFVTATRDTTVIVNDTVILAFRDGTNANLTICLGENIKIQIDSANCQALTITPALPAGLTFANGKISGTPTGATSTPYIYTITATSNKKPACETKTLTGTIHVNDTVKLTFPDGTNANPTICLGGNIEIQIDSANCQALTITPELPAGLTFANGKISGKPTGATSTSYTYTITANSNKEPACNAKTLTGIITVNDTVNLSLASNSGDKDQTLCIGSNINNIIVDTANCTTDISWNTSAITGLTYANGIISGAPTTTAFTSDGASTTYTITATSTHGCSQKTLSGTITLNDTVKVETENNFVITDTTQTLCLGDSIKPISFKVENGTMTCSGLGTSGLSFNTNSNGSYTITGIPNAAGDIHYTLTATSNKTPQCGTKTITGTIHVNDTVKVTWNSQESTITDTVQELCLGHAIKPISFKVENGTMTCSDLGTPGLFFSNNNDNGTYTLQGTPTNIGTIKYTLSATNPANCSSKTIHGHIVVNDTVNLSLASNSGVKDQTLCIGRNINDIIVDTANCTTAITWNNTAITGLTYANGKIYGTPTTESFTNGVASTTYEITATSTHGCSEKKLSGTITLNDTLHPVITSYDSICLNASLRFDTLTLNTQTDYSNHTHEWTMTGEAGSFVDNVANTATVKATWNTIGTKTVSVKVTNSANCSGRATKTINVLDTATFSLAADHKHFCADAYDTLTVNAATGSQTISTYDWATVDGLTLTAGDAANKQAYKAANGAATSTYTVGVTVTTDKGCQTKKETTITVDSLPRPTITADFDAVCINSSDIHDTLTLSTENIYNPYVWTLTDGQGGSFVDNVSNTATVKAQWNTNGTKSVTVKVTDEKGCSNSATKADITVNDTVRLRLASNSDTKDQTLCIGGNINYITVDTANCTTAITWSNENITGLTYANGKISGTPTTELFTNGVASTTYTITATSTHGCNPKTLTGIITVNDTVNLAFHDGTNANPTICLGENIKIQIDSANCQALTITPALPAGLTFANGKISGTPTTESFTYGVASTTYTITATSTHGCSQKILSGTITVNDTVKLTQTAGPKDTTICLGQPLPDITFNVVNGTMNVIWDSHDELTWNTNTITGTPTTAETITYKIAATSSHSCTAKASDTIKHSITITDTVQPSITAEDICLSASEANDTLTLSTQSDYSNFTHTWVLDGATTVDNTTTNSTTVKAQWATAGEKTITVAVKQGECIGRATKTITVNDTTTFVVNGTNFRDEADGFHICMFNEGTLTPSEASLTYTWTPTDSLSGDVTKTFKSSKKEAHTYQVTGENDKGCQLTKSVTVTVDTVPVITLTPTDVLCYGGETGKMVASVIGGTDFHYDWNNGTSTVGTNDATLSDMPIGRYYVTVTNGFGCTATANDTIRQPDTLTIEVTEITHISCYTSDDEGEIKVKVVGGKTPYKYYVNDEDNGQNDEEVTFSYLAATTYTIKAEDANHCTAKVDTVIIRPAKLEISHTTHNPSCYGNSDGSIETTTTGGWDGSTHQYVWKKGDEVIAHGTDVATLVDKEAGTYTLTVTETEKSCEAYDTIRLTHPKDFNVVISGIDSICAGGNTEFTATVSETTGNVDSIYTLVWYNVDNPSGITIFDQTTISNISTSGKYAVVATQNNTTTCQKSDTVTLTVLEVPELVFTYSPNDTVCFGTADTIRVSGAHTCVWNNNSTESWQEVTQTIGIHEYKVTGRNTFGTKSCVTSAEDTVVVLPLPSATLELNGNVINSNTEHQVCELGTVELSVSEQDGASYQWYKNDNELANETSRTYTLSNVNANEHNGAYYVKVRFATGCDSTSYKVNVTVNPLPTTALTATVDNVTVNDPYNITVCAGKTVKVETPQADGFEYKWTKDDTEKTPTAVLTFNGIATEDAGEYYLYVKNTSTGCDSTSKKVTITVDTLPVITLTSFDSICINTSERFDTLTLTTEAAAEYTYAWTIGGNNTIVEGGANNDNTVKVQWSEVGTPNVSVQVTNGRGCSSTANKSISVKDIDDFSIAAEHARFCADAYDTLTVTGDATTTFEWSAPAALTMTGNAATQKAFKAANNSNTTEFTVTVKGTTDKGCQLTKEQVITVDSLPVVTVNDPSVCLNGTVALIATGADSYAWTPSTNLDATNGASVNYASTTSGTYKIAVTGSDSHNCSATDTATVTVNNLPSVSANISRVNERICLNDTASFSIVLPSNSTCAWTSTLGRSSLTDTTQNRVIFTGSTANNTTGYSITVKVTDENGCEASDTKNIIVDTLPTVVITANGGVCQNDTITFTTRGDEVSDWNWTYTETNETYHNINNNILKVVWNESAGSTEKTVTVNYKDHNGCRSNGTDTVKKVNVYGLPVVKINPDKRDTAICRGSSINLTATTGTPAATAYTWDNNVGNDNAVTVTPVTNSTFVVTGSYTPATTNLVCRSTDTITVTLKDTVQLTVENPEQTKCLGQPIDTIKVNYAAATIGWNVTTPSADGIVTEEVAGFYKIYDTITVASTDPYIYTVTATSTNGCGSKEKNISITINDTTMLTFDNAAVATQTNCLGQSIDDIKLNLSNCTVTFVPDLEGYGLSYNTETHKISGTPNAARTQTFTITSVANDNICNGYGDAKTLKFTITVNDTNTLSSTSDLEQTICLGQAIDNIVLDTANCTLAFSLNSNNELSHGLSYDATNHQITGVPDTAMVFNIQVTASNTNACNADKILDIKVTVNDTVKIAKATSEYLLRELCKDASISTPMKVWATNGTVAIGSSGTKPNGLSSTSSTNNDTISLDGTLIAAGTYEFYVVATGTACTTSKDSVKVKIVVDTIPVVTITTTDNVICPNGQQSVPLTATSGFEKYTWSTNGIEGNVNTTTISTAGTYTVTVKDNNGCTNETEIEITAHDLPGTTLASDPATSEICYGKSATLTATSTNAVSYEWIGITTAQNDAQLTVSPVADSTFYVRVVDVHGCYDTAHITITVHALPTPGLTPTEAAVCQDSTLTLNASTASGLSYVWKVGEVVVNEGHSNYTYAPVVTTDAENYKISVQVTDGNGCVNSDTAKVKVNRVPVLSATSNNVRCYGEGTAFIDLTVTNTTNNTFAWSDNVTTEDRTHLRAGEYKVTVTSQDGGNCAKDTTIEIKQNAKLEATFFANKFYLCQGYDTVTVTATGGTDVKTYEWYKDGDIVRTTTVDTFYIEGISLSAGTHEFAVTVVDDSNCVAQAIFQGTTDKTIWEVTSGRLEVNREINFSANETYVLNVGGGSTRTLTSENDGDIIEVNAGESNGRCDSIIIYTVHVYGVGMHFTNNFTVQQSSYSKPYIFTAIPTHIGDTLWAGEGEDMSFYAYISTTENVYSNARVDMKYEVLLNDHLISSSDFNETVDNLKISSYYEKLNSFHGYTLHSANGECPANTFVFQYPSNSSAQYFDYFNFDAFNNMPQKIDFNFTKPGTYTIKLVVERRYAGSTPSQPTGIYNPLVVSSHHGPIWGGRGDNPTRRDTIVARYMTVIVGATNSDNSNSGSTGVISGIEEYTEGAEPTVVTYPNPAHDMLYMNISGMEGATRITITDAAGKVVATDNVNLISSETTLNYSLAQFAQGVYFLNVYNDGAVITKKFIVTK